MNLTINGKEYNAKFGYGAFRKICEFYGESKISDFDKLITRFKVDDDKDDSFEKFAFFGNLVKLCVENAGEVVEFTEDDVIDAMMQGSLDFQEFFLEFRKSLPQDNSKKNGGKKAGRKQ